MKRVQTHQKFMRWLDHALCDERWRAFIRAQVEQHELPVIDMDARTSRRSDPPETRQHPR